MFTHIQGKGVEVSNSSIALTLDNPVGSGNTLIATLSIFVGSVFDSLPDPTTLSDNKNNFWEFVAMSPVQVDGTGKYAQSVTLIATNCAAGSTTISFGPFSNNICLTVDEYFGPAIIRAVDQITFNSTTYSSGATSISSKTITIPANEMLYSVIYTDKVSNTFTSTSGFTSRTLQNSSQLSVQTFDQLSPASGVYESDFTVTGTVPDTIHVILFSISSAPLKQNGVVQISYGTGNSTFGTSVSATFKKPNTKGNLLIALCRTKEVGDFTAADTLTNSWIVPYTAPGGQSLSMGYVLNCKAGTNTITFQSHSGGSDVSLALTIIEYQGALNFIGSSFGQNTGSSCDTGGVTSTAFSTLLISGLVDPTNGNNPPIISTSINRMQLSDAGFQKTNPCTTDVADKIVVGSGTYNNVFSILPNTANLNAAILAFSTGCFKLPFPITQYFDIFGNPLSNGTLHIKLSYDCSCPCDDYQVTGNDYVIIQLDSTGTIVGSPQFRPNNQLFPSGSYYVLEAYSSTGQLAVEPQKVTI